MAGRARWTQRILNNKVRLVRGKFHPISFDQLMKHWDELKAKQEQGLIVVLMGSPRGKKYHFEVKEGAVQAQPETPEVPDDEPEDEEEAEEAGAEQVEAADAPDSEQPAGQGPDLDKMNKSQLVAYAAEKLGEAPGVLERMTKAEIKELLA
jgi:hypothetical protein